MKCLEHFLNENVWSEQKFNTCTSCLICVTVGKSQKVVEMLKTKKFHCCTYKIA